MKLLGFINDETGEIRMFAERFWSPAHKDWIVCTKYYILGQLGGTKVTRTHVEGPYHEAGDKLETIVRAGAWRALLPFEYESLRLTVARDE